MELGVGVAEVEVVVHERVARDDAEDVHEPLGGGADDGADAGAADVGLEDGEVDVGVGVGGVGEAAAAPVLSPSSPLTVERHTKCSTKYMSQMQTPLNFGDRLETNKI